MTAPSLWWTKGLRAIADSAAVSLLASQMSFAVGSAAAASLEEIKKRGYMIVATEDDFRPFEFVQDGKPAGFDNDLLAILTKSATFAIHQEIITWKCLHALVSNDKYDVDVRHHLP